MIMTGMLCGKMLGMGELRRCLVHQIRLKIVGNKNLLSNRVLEYSYNRENEKIYRVNVGYW